jgi:hypothetical protein
LLYDLCGVECVLFAVVSGGDEVGDGLEKRREGGRKVEGNDGQS